MMDDISLLNYFQSSLEMLKRKIYKLNLKPRDLFLCFDLDNTLALFCKKGESEKALRESSQKGFFENLGLCEKHDPEALEFISEFRFNIVVISKATLSPYCEEEKRKWVHSHFPFIDDSNIIIIRGNETLSKAQAFERVFPGKLSRAILIDDYKENLINFLCEGGGWAIKRTESRKKRTIPQVHSMWELITPLMDLWIP